MIDIRWVWLFLHHEGGGASQRAAEEVDAVWDWWAQATGTTLSARRGERGEFATLVPADGDAWVKLQRTQVGDGTHLDLSVEDVDTAADEAVRLGAERVDSYPGVRVMRSPGGYPFCLTDWHEQGRPSRQVRTGHDELLDQICLDVPTPAFESEVEFWAALTGWGAKEVGEPEFRALEQPEGIPVRFLLQRVGGDAGEGAAQVVTGHPDLSCVDRDRSVREWTRAGAEVVDPHRWWTVMRDPEGLVFCLTDRHPATGVVAS